MEEILKFIKWLELEDLPMKLATVPTSFYENKVGLLRLPLLVLFTSATVFYTMAWSLSRVEATNYSNQGSEQKFKASDIKCILLFIGVVLMQILIAFSAVEYFICLPKTGLVLYYLILSVIFILNILVCVITKQIIVCGIINFILNLMIVFELTRRA